MNKWKIDYKNSLYYLWRRKTFGWEYVRNFVFLDQAEKFIEDHKDFPKYYK